MRGGQRITHKGAQPRCSRGAGRAAIRRACDGRAAAIGRGLHYVALRVSLPAVSREVEAVSREIKGCAATVRSAGDREQQRAGKGAGAAGER